MLLVESLKKSVFSLAWRRMFNAQPITMGSRSRRAALVTLMMPSIAIPVIITMMFHQDCQTCPVMPIFFGNLLEAWKLSGNSSISSRSNSYTLSKDWEPS